MPHDALQYILFISSISIHIFVNKHWEDKAEQSLIAGITSLSLRWASLLPSPSAVSLHGGQALFQIFAFLTFELTGTNGFVKNNISVRFAHLGGALNKIPFASWIAFYIWVGEIVKENILVCSGHSRS